MLALAPSSSNKSNYGPGSNQGPIRSLPSLTSQSSLAGRGNQSNKQSTPSQQTRSLSAPPFLDHPRTSSSSSTKSNHPPPHPSRTPSSSSATQPNSLSSRPASFHQPSSNSTSSSSPSHHRLPSSSSMSLPRMPAAHMSSAPPSPSGAYPGQQQQQQQQGPFAFPNQAGYPFIPPSPLVHPHQMGFPQHSPGFGAPGSGAGGMSAQEHQRMMLAQQQQQMHWQNEMARQAHQNQLDWQQQGSHRRRATSGPAPTQHTPKFYPNSAAYPMPQLAHHQIYPSTAPQLGALHGYPSPPASDGSSGGRADGYHPYRRGDRGGEGHKEGGGGAGKAVVTRVPVPPILPPVGSQMSSGGGSGVGGKKAGGRYSMEFPALPGKQPSGLAAPVSGAGGMYQSSSGQGSSSTVNSTTHTRSSSTSALNSARTSPIPPASGPPPASIRPRTESQASTRSSSQSSARPSIGAHGRSASSSDVGSVRDRSSFDSSRGGATPTPGKKPSPLGRAQVEDEYDSDSTAGAAEGQRAPSRQGVAGRFENSFGSKGSISGLGEADLNGQRPPQVQARQRVESSSSAESSAPKTPPNQHGALPKVAAGAGTTAAAVPAAGSSASSTRPLVAAKTGRFSMLNPRANGSTDNLSISSTVSSASMMLRKIGNMGKLARRSSMMSLTKAFGRKKDKKKAASSSASVSHATAEVEASGDKGISPAAALARKHQQLYAEQERQAAAEAAAASAVRSFEVHARNDSGASEASSGGGKAGKKSRKWGFGSSSKNKENDDAASVAEDASVRVAGGGKFGSAGDGAAFDPDRTPRQSLEVLDQPHAAYRPFNEDGTYPGQDEGEYQSSLAGMPMWKRDAKAAKGVLKGAGTYNQEDYAPNRASQQNRRAASFDASHGSAPSAMTPSGGVLSHDLPDATTIDGAAVAEARTHPDGPSHVLSDSPGPSTPTSPGTSPYTLPALNASAPALHGPFLGQPVRAQSAPAGPAKKISFAANLSVHTTWPAGVYDRKPELGTCNKLTPTLAQRIKEELNAFKMEEMEVHPSSRCWTQFFV